MVVDGQSIGAQSAYTFQNVTAPHSIHATFSAITHTITASAGTGGSIDPPGAVEVMDGGSRTFRMVPNDRQQVRDVAVDGQSVGAVTEYTFSDIDASHTIHATFELIKYTIEAGAGPGGSVSPSGSVVIGSGWSQTFSIIPDRRYKITDVLVDGQSVGAVTNYTFSDISANHTIQASFELIIFTITATATAGGTIDPSGEIQLVIWDSQAFSIVPLRHYQIKDVKVDGQSVGTPTSYTFQNVDASHTIQAAFEPIMFTIQASGSPNGAIVPSGAVEIMSGTSQTFTMTPNDGYQTHNVLIDGHSLGPAPSYDFVNIDRDRSIEAFFAPEGTLLNRISRQDYVQSTIEIGASVYADSLHEYLPPVMRYLSGHTTILTQRVDGDASDSEFLQFDIGMKSTVLISLDHRTEGDGLPGWLRDKRWKRHPLLLYTNDTPSTRTLYMRDFPPGTVKLGPNRDENMPSGRRMYSIIVRPENPDSQAAPASWMLYR